MWSLAADAGILSAAASRPAVRLTRDIAVTAIRSCIAAIVMQPMVDSITNMRLLVLLLAAMALRAADEITVYDLLAPATHSFDIIYDVTATREGAPYFS